MPAPVSLKNVLKASSPPPTVLSLGICPSGCKIKTIENFRLNIEQENELKSRKIRGSNINLNAMFKAVELPASVSDLDTGLTNVDRNALSHFRLEMRAVNFRQEGTSTEMPKTYTKTSEGKRAK